MKNAEGEKYIFKKGIKNLFSNFRDIFNLW